MRRLIIFRATELFEVLKHGTNRYGENEDDGRSSKRRRRWCEWRIWWRRWLRLKKIKNYRSDEENWRIEEEVKGMKMKKTLQKMIFDEGDDNWRRLKQIEDDEEGEDDDLENDEENWKIIKIEADLRSWRWSGWTSTLWWNNRKSRQCEFRFFGNLKNEHLFKIAFYGRTWTLLLTLLNEQTTQNLTPVYPGNAGICFKTV